MKMRLLAILALLLLSAVVAAADDPPHQLTLDESFAVQPAEILAALDDGETYSEITLEDRAAVIKHLKQISEVLAEARSETFATLSSGRQTEAINSQELVNQPLTEAADDSRLVCVHERRLGRAPS